jgi:hypothetical protein
LKIENKIRIRRTNKDGEEHKFLPVTSFSAIGGSPGISQRGR